MSDQQPPEESARPADESAPDVALGDRVASLQSAKDAYWGRMLRSGGLAVIGLLVSAYTYFTAMFSGSGGTYFVFFGAVIYGVGNAYVAATRYVKVKRALETLQAQHGAAVIDAAVAAWADGLLGPDVESTRPATPMPKSGLMIPESASPQKNRLIGITVMVSAACTVLVPATLILLTGSLGSMLAEMGIVFVSVLVLIDLGFAALLGYTGLRYLAHVPEAHRTRTST